MLLTVRRALGRGRYTLALSTRHGRRQITTHQEVTIG
jgi:hypothetical protein